MRWSFQHEGFLSVVKCFRRENEVVFSMEVSCQTQRLHVFRRENEVVFLA